MGNRASREAGPAVLPAATAAASGQQAPDASSAAASECPVPAEFRQQVYKNAAVYNVYNQRINDPAAPPAGAGSPLPGLPGQDVLDPKNNMPLEPNQQPCPGQKKLLSTDRMASNIPKGGTDATWVYPSPQMFFNGGCTTGGGRGAGCRGRAALLLLCSRPSRHVHPLRLPARPQRCGAKARVRMWRRRIWMQWCSPTTP